MKKIEEYYKNTKNALPHKNVLEFMRIENKVGKAIDLGCGAGRDAIYLIKNGRRKFSINEQFTNPENNSLLLVWR